MFTHTSTSSVVTIAIVILLCMIKIFTMEVPDDTEWSVFLPSRVGVDNQTLNPEMTIFDIFSTVSTFMFAMGSQGIFLEMMSAMREPSHSPRSLYSGTLVILIVYAFVSIATYAKVGKW